MFLLASDKELHDILGILSLVFGWLYFAAWTISGYPQMFLNYYRKSVRGLSVDFIYLSTLGFVCYSIYNAGFYYFPKMQIEYRSRHDGNSNLIMVNDVFFAVHSLLISILILFQYWFYEKDESQHLSHVGKVVIVSSVSALVAVLALNSIYGLLIVSSYLKLVLTVMKYIPQAYSNYKRKSTDGWSVVNVLCDLVGGVLSFSQLLIDAVIEGNIRLAFNNPAKLALALISIAFDLLFVVQHYVLYVDSPAYERSSDTPNHQELFAYDEGHDYGSPGASSEYKGKGYQKVGHDYGYKYNYSYNNNNHTDIMELSEMPKSSFHSNSDTLNISNGSPSSSWADIAPAQLSSRAGPKPRT